MMRLTLAAALLTLAACATTPAVENPDKGPTLPAVGEDTCNARQYASLIGQPATSPGVPPATRDVRHIHPDSAVTLDLSQQRLNVMIDDAGRIYAFRCY